MRKYSLFILIVLLVVFQNPLRVHAKALLLISQEFPQVPVKPLSWVTREPHQETINFLNQAGKKVVADIFYPSTLLRQAQDRSGQAPKTYPAVIIAMGVKTSEKDRPIILGFAKTLARLGYVVVWPRLAELDQGVSKMERPETFITSFKLLEKNNNVIQNKISFVGFSIGSSIALVAAQNPSINHNVNAIVFFGGYFNIFDYLKSLEGKTDWQPDEGATNHLKEILETEKISLDDKDKLNRINPVKNINNFRAKIFILHEKGDTYVPYIESIKLKEALENQGRKPEAYHLANLFEHVQPKGETSREMLQEFFNLYLFAARVFENL